MGPPHGADHSNLSSMSPVMPCSASSIKVSYKEPLRAFGALSYAMHLPSPHTLSCAWMSWELRLNLREGKTEGTMEGIERTKGSGLRLG